MPETQSCPACRSLEPPYAKCTHHGWFAICPACSWLNNNPLYHHSRDAALRGFFEGKAHVSAEVGA